MRTNQLIPILAFLIASPFATGQDTTPKDPRWKQLSQAYGFVLGQQASLALIEQKFSDLAPDVKQAWFAFNASALGDSVKGVEGELSTELGDKWPSMKEKMAKQMEEMVNGQQFTRDQAVVFLTEVTSRSKGQLPDSIRAALLSAHPRFSKNPGLELIEGWNQTFSSKGHPKAKGADFSLSFPASWSKREGSRPNVIQVFQSGAGHGAIVATLMVKDIPLPAGYKPTEEEVMELFQPDALKEIIGAGEDWVDSKSIVLDGSPAGMVVSDQTKQRLDVTLKMRVTQFVTLHGSSMIFIQFMVAKMPDTTQSLDELQKLYVPTYKAIANTFIFNDKYK